MANKCENIKYPLISVVKICNNNAIIVCINKKAYITRNKKIIDTVNWDKKSKLWTLPLVNNDDNKVKS